MSQEVFNMRTAEAVVAVHVLGSRVRNSEPCTNSEEPGMSHLRLIVATFLVLACAACSQGGGAAGPSPSGTSRSTDPSTAPTTPASSASTSSVPPALRRYSEPQRVAFGTAVAAYDRFVSRNDAFYAAGQTTGAARRFYHHYATDWSTAWGNLAQVVNAHATVTGSTRTMWTRPQSIDLHGAQGEVVVIHRCLDESRLVVRQNGKKLAQPELKEPHIYTVRLVKRPGEEWWRAGIAQQGPTC